MHSSFARGLSVALLAGCGGGDSAPVAGAVPAAASALATKLNSDMLEIATMVGLAQGSLLSVFNPASPLAQGVTVVPDPNPGAPANSITFNGPYDADGDGFKETTMSGRATFGSDPNNSWSSVNGQMTLDLSLPIVGSIYRSDLSFAITSSGARIAGTGTFNELGTTIVATVPAASPLVVSQATGAPGAVANACGHSLDGQIQLDASTGSGRMTSSWAFSSDRPTVAVLNTIFTDPSGQSIVLPDSSVDLRCGGAGSVNDWVARFEQNYSCLPRESGRARLTLSAIDASTIAITDEDPPGITQTYRATLLAANPHSLRGFFIGGPPGNQYREDFNWTLDDNGAGFSQFSTYVYFEGALIGQGGVCVATAKRMP